MVAEFFQVEGPLPFAVADAGADGGDHGADFGVLKDLVEAGFFDVDKLAADGEDGLVTAVPALLGRAAGGVALDDVKLGVGGVAVGAIGQFAGEAAAGKGAFADGVAGLASGLAGAGGHEALVNDLARHGRVGVKKGHQPLINDGGDDAFDFRIDKLDLGLGFEARIGQLDAKDAHQSLTHVVTGNGRVLFLEQIVRARVLVDGAGQGRAKAGEMCPAVGIGNGVGKSEYLVGVTVVVLQHAIHDHFVLLTRQDDGFGMQDLLVAAKLADKLLDAVLVEKSLLLVLDPLVGERDFDARIQKRQFAQAVGEQVEFEFGGDGENRRVGLEGDEGAGALGFTDDFELAGGDAALEGHVIDLIVARNLDLEPVGKGVDALGADAVEAAGIFVGALAEFAAGMEVGQHQLDGGHLPFRVHVHGDASAIVANGDRAVHMDGHADLLAKAGEMFVNRIVEHLENTVMQPALVGIADIHAGPFSDGFQPLEFVNFRGVVFYIWIRIGAHFSGNSTSIWPQKPFHGCGLSRPERHPQKIRKKPPKNNFYLRLSSRKNTISCGHLARLTLRVVERMRAGIPWLS